jgi:hypothetical protein
MSVWRWCFFQGLCLAVGWFGVCAPAMAGNWLVCDFTVKVVEKSQNDISVVLVNTSKRNPPECAQQGVEWTFTPESPNYQNPLPRAKWPKVNRLAHLRYRALVGVCKGDGRNHPCTIRHYSIMD